LRGATPPISPAISVVIVHTRLACEGEEDKGRKRKKKIAMIALAGSSVSIVGLYDGILTVQFSLAFLYTTRRYGAYGREKRAQPSLTCTRVNETAVE